MPKKLLIGAAALIVLLVAAALVAPSFVDWNAYRPQLVAAVKEATGRDLAVDGGLALSVLPAPELSAKDVRLSSVPGATEPDMVRLKELEVRVALFPLLSGEIKVESVRLIAPVIVLEELKDGRNNWTFAPAERPQAGGEEAKRAGGGDGGFALSLDDVRVSDAAIVYRNARTGTEQRIDGLSFEGSAGSLRGPFSLDGELTLAAAPLSFEAHIGALEQGRPAALRFTVASKERGASAEFNGSFAAGPDMRLAGKLKAQAASLAKALGQASPLLERPVELDSAIEASATAAAANDMSLRFGDMQAGGAVSLALGDAPRFDATLQAARLDLDALLAAAQAGGGAKPSSAGGQAGKAGQEGFAIPAELTGAIAATVDGVVYRGAAIRQAQLNAEIRGGKVTLRRLKALLPGGSDLALSGALATPQGKPQFDGRLELASDNLRGLLGWLKVEPSGAPADRLNTASLTAAVRASPELAELGNINLRLDGSTITGGAAMRLQQRPSFAVDLAVDRFNLDGYLGQDGAAAKPAAAGGQQPQGAKAKPDFSALDGFDANVKLRAAQLTYNRTPLRNVALDATLAAGKLTLSELRAQDPGGATIRATGAASDFAATPKFKGELTLAADDLSGLAQLAGMRTTGAAAKAGRTDVKAQVEGSLDAVDFDAEGSLAGGRLKAQGKATGLQATPAFDATVIAEHKDLAALVRNFGVDWRPAAQNLGGLTLDLVAKGTAAALELPSLKVKAGPAQLEGAGRMKLDGPRPYLNADLRASEILLDLFLPASSGGGQAAQRAGGGSAMAAASRQGEPRWSGEPLDLSGLEALDADVTLAARGLTFKDYPFKEPRLALALKDGAMNVRELTGKLFDGAVALNGQLASRPQPALTLDVKLDGADVQQALTTAMGMDKVSGKLDFAGQFRSTGRSERDLVGNLGGDARLSMGEGVVRGVDLASLSQRLGELNGAAAFLDLAARSFSGGQTRIRSASGTWQVKNGVATTRDTKALLDAAEATLVGDIQLPAWRMDLQSEIALVEHPKAPPIGVTLRGPLDSPQRDVRSQAMEQYLAARVGSELLRKGLGDKAGPLGAILGGGRQPQQAPATQSAPAQPAPAQQPAAPPAQQAIEGLLKGLLKK